MQTFYLVEHKINHLATRVRTNEQQTHLSHALEQVISCVQHVLYL